MPDRINPTDAANAAFDDGWAKLIDTHNQKNRARYTQTSTAPTTASLQNAYEKFLRAADFLNPHTVIICLDGFEKDEMDTILYYLDKTNVHSTMEWSEVHQGTPQITIRDGDNVHHTSSPLQIIKDQQNRLFKDSPDFAFGDEPVAPPPKAAPAQPEVIQEAEPLYIPPFNTITVPWSNNQSFAYILLEHMHYQDVRLLEEALQSRGITFNDRDSDNYGSVLAVPFNFEQFETLGKMMKEALTPENQGRREEHARIYRTPPGDPAINVIDDNGTKYIPIDGMMPKQTAALGSRLNIAGIPYEPEYVTTYGPAFIVEEQYGEKLEALRKQLRAEHNGRKGGTMAQPAGAFAEQRFE